MERDEATKEKLRESQKMLSVLDAFAKEEVRNDFCNELSGAFKLTDKELGLLDDFSGLVQSIELGSKLDANAAESTEHLIYLIESKNKPIPSMEITYAELRKLFDRIINAVYWNKEAVVEASVAAVVEEQRSVQDHVVEPLQSNLIEPMNNLNVGLEKPSENLIHNCK